MTKKKKHSDELSAEDAVKLAESLVNFATAQLSYAKSLIKVVLGVLGIISVVIGASFLAPTCQSLKKNSEPSKDLHELKYEYPGGRARKGSSRPASKSKDFTDSASKSPFGRLGRTGRPCGTLAPGG